MAAPAATNAAAVPQAIPTIGIANSPSGSKYDNGFPKQ